MFGFGAAVGVSLTMNQYLLCYSVDATKKATIQIITSANVVQGYWHMYVSQCFNSFKLKCICNENHPPNN